jgi:hypothetical protein
MLHGASSVTHSESSTLDLDIDAVGLTTADKPEMDERESPTLANACQQSTEGSDIGRFVLVPC